MHLHARGTLAFPPGANASDTLIGGAHFNLTTLQHWNYTYYTNRTISNNSHCYLMWQPYTPVMFSNGSFVNSTSCYSAINTIGPRADVGIVMAILLALSLLLTLMNLRKHGRKYLPTQKRFAPVGRRWQWYWMSMTAAFGIISGMVSIDVDRYYLPQIPIVLQNLFWFLMLPCTMAAVWESVRHWGSWQERQLIDPDPFSLRQDDRRSRVEFWLPLIFYLFDFLNFFFVIPRNWSKIEEQRSPGQTQAQAEPAATDARFKVAAFCLIIAWLVTVFSLRHSIYHYKPRDGSTYQRSIRYLRHAPVKFMFSLPLMLVSIGYVLAAAFVFDISSLNVDANPGWIYGLGWVPLLLILYVYEVAGWIEPNDDKELIRQRHVRGVEVDRELGITKRPAWWNRAPELGVHDQLAANVREVGGGRPTTRHLERAIEMGNMPVSQQLHDRLAGSTMVHGRMPSDDVARRRGGRAAGDHLFSSAASLLFPRPGVSDHAADDIEDRPAQRRAASFETQESGELGPQQQVRSMLDV